MYSYKLNNSYTVYVNYSYLNECIQASRKHYSRSNEKAKKATTVCAIPIIAKKGAKIGSRISVVNLDTQEKNVYTITYSENVNISEGFISDVSPIGRSLLGHGIGEMVTVNTPSGAIRYKIIDLKN